MEHLDDAALQAGLARILDAPKDAGTLDLIVCRPGLGQREVLEQGELDLAVGLIGDSWSARPSRRTDDGGPHPRMQLNIMSTRVVSLVAQRVDRWALAGDQLYVDLDLSHENVPAGTLLTIGSTVVEVTEQPHLGCAKFTKRFGLAAHRFVNSEQGKALRLRGLNAAVVVPGTIRPGDAVLVQREASAAMAAGTSSAGTASE